MIKVDPSVLAPDVAVLLQLRGAALPSLRWYDKPNQAAKQVLLDIEDDARLFRQTTLADEPMVGAVRAVLYLWNGWRRGSTRLEREWSGRCNAGSSNCSLRTAIRK